MGAIFGGILDLLPHVFHGKKKNSSYFAAESRTVPERLNTVPGMTHEDHTRTSTT